MCECKTVMINVPTIQGHPRHLLLSQLYWKVMHNYPVVHFGHVWPLIYHEIYSIIQGHCWKIPGGGGTHILIHTGMCRSNRSLFDKKSLNVGPIFNKNIPKHGFIFRKIFQNFQMLAWQTPKKCEKWAYISRKIPKNGYPFLPEWPLNMGMGFEARSADFCPNQIWVPPGEKYNSHF